jgi:uncharacterized protein with HEPN domain
VKQVRVLLQHMLDAMVAIQDYTRGGRAAFLADRMVRDAVVRNLEVLGEAAKNVPGEFRVRHPGTEWSRIAGLRDVLIHQYFGIDYAVVWDTVAQRVPILRRQVEAMLADEAA